MSEHAMRYTFENKEKPIILIIEPWAEEILVGYKSVVTINILFDKIGQIETEINSTYFTIWLWRGCRAELFLDGENRTPGSLSIPAPG